MQLNDFLFVLTLATLCVLFATNSFCMGYEHVDRNIKNIMSRAEAKNKSVSKYEDDAKFWLEMGKNILEEKIKIQRQYGIAKNVIFFLGDGMSIPTLTAARIYKGQMKGKTGEEETLTFEKFPFTGLSKTYCVDSQVGDSACTATAYLTGVKSNIETIGVSGKVKNRDCKGSIDSNNRTESLLRWAQKANKRTGLITNMRITHATPAGAYASIANRGWESDHDINYDIFNGLAHRECLETSDIARQLIESETGQNLNVILGGGLGKFIPNYEKDVFGRLGERIDGKNLIKKWTEMKKDKKAKFVMNRSELMAVDNKTDYLFGLFAYSHMEFNLTSNKKIEPSLVEMTEKAINILSNDKNGYVLFIESGNIDWAHHDNWAHIALDETVMLSNAVEKALQLTNSSETLIVVTSDHAHTMTLNGYPHRGADIFGHAKNSDIDQMPLSTLSYANGLGVKPSRDGKRYNLTDDDTHDKWYQFQAMVPLTKETHGGDDVAVFAKGPWAHLFVGNYEQNYIPFAISYAAKIGPGAKDHRNSAAEIFSFNTILLLITISIGQFAINN
ncbi:alkaline phosphatase-like [Daktulosphaira vitifoliae]|uniref:alkaline phosphatase-like n=1 Tax=Daktulosphaira vitifoliae TaxID=58002 RepID=UPI0021A9F73C|nr:alkaline phosphatase-like [Daktulosphaira vitifoliae]